MLPARLADFGAQLDLFQDANDLAFTEFRFLHVETPFLGILYSQLAQVFEVASRAVRGLGQGKSAKRSIATDNFLLSGNEASTFVEFPLTSDVKKALAPKEIESGEVDAARFLRAAMQESGQHRQVPAKYLVRMGELWCYLVELHRRRSVTAKMSAKLRAAIHAR